MTLAYGPALLVFSLGAIAEERGFLNDESLKLEQLHGAAIDGPHEVRVLVIG